MTIIRARHELDATGKVLGRLASQVATLLSGKRKTGYRANSDNGDFVSVKNCTQVVLTGNKLAQKVYRRYSGYPGGLKETPIQRMLEKKPTEVVYHAVYRMLPANRLRKDRMKRLTLIA